MSRHTDISRKYDYQHARHIQNIQGEIEALFIISIDFVFKNAEGIRPKGNVFSIGQYTKLKRAMKAIMRSLHHEVTITIQNGIKSEWQYAIEKNEATIAAKYGRPLPEQLLNPLNRKSDRALQNLLTQRLSKRGLTLSDRVWKLTKQFQNEIEKTLFAGIQEGKSAANMAQELKRNLLEPDKIFRRVRDSEGKLKLSKAAREYHPGQGVYRSSFKNAARLARHETNKSYRLSDITRWRNMPMVLGYRTKLSAKHPKYDICDPMSGITFPVSFMWEGWHVNCLCSLESVLADRTEFNRYIDSILEGKPAPAFSGRVTEMPEKFMDYVKENLDTYKGWKSLPKFLEDNPQLGFNS